MIRFLRCALTLFCASLLACASAEPWRAASSPWAHRGHVLRGDGNTLVGGDVVQLQTKRPSNAQITATWVTAGLLIAGIILASTGIIAVNGGVNLSNSVEARAGTVQCDSAAPLAGGVGDRTDDPCPPAAGALSRR